MSNVHVLTQRNGVIRMAFHVPIPNSSNPRGVNYRTALINSRIGGQTSLPDGDGTGGTISTAEKTSVISGAVYEYVIDIKRAPTTNAEVDALFTKISGEVQAGLQAQLDNFGYTR